MIRRNQQKEKTGINLGIYSFMVSVSVSFNSPQLTHSKFVTAVCVRDIIKATLAQRRR